VSYTGRSRPKQQNRSSSLEPGRKDDERQHNVTLTKGFHMQTTEVTQGQWRAVMGNNPSYFKDCGDNCPVLNVSWNDVQIFIQKLKKKETNKYRLPTEAVWEYAACAGNKGSFFFGNDDGKLKQYAWYSKNLGYQTHPVALKKHNKFGLYDIHGNVFEWCQDRYRINYHYDSNTDPTGPPSGSHRVYRGGGWSYGAGYCRLAARYGDVPDYTSAALGFRIAHSSGQ